MLAKYSSLSRCFRWLRSVRIMRSQKWRVSIKNSSLQAFALHLDMVEVARSIRAGPTTFSITCSTLPILLAKFWQYFGKINAVYSTLISNTPAHPNDAAPLFIRTARSLAGRGIGGISNHGNLFASHGKTRINEVLFAPKLPQTMRPTLTAWPCQAWHRMRMRNHTPPTGPRF